MPNVVGTLSEPEFDLFIQVCTELDNHYSMNDKDLAEFIIDLAQKHADLEVRTTSTYQSVYIRLFFGHFEKNSRPKNSRILKNSRDFSKNSRIFYKNSRIFSKNSSFCQLLNFEIAAKKKPFSSRLRRASTGQSLTDL